MSLFEQLRNSEQFFLIAGPCAVESGELIVEVAERVERLCVEREIPYVFKSSFKKANRSKLDSFTGIGDELAISHLENLKEKFHVPICTDVHRLADVHALAGIADVMQIPAFLCRQTDLLLEAGKSGAIVSVKKGQFASAETMRFAAEKIRSTSNQKVVLVERGNSFGYSDLVVDMRNIPRMKQFGCPVVLDCTHANQKPNGPSGVTKGESNFIESLARAGIACSVDGLFIECHPNPELALSDAENMLALDALEPLLDKLVKLRKTVNEF